MTQSPSERCKSQRRSSKSARIRASFQWAHLAHNLNNLDSASKAYDQATRLLPQVVWIGLNAIAKELNSDIQTLGGLYNRRCTG